MSQLYACIYTVFIKIPIHWYAEGTWKIHLVSPKITTNNSKGKHSRIIIGIFLKLTIEKLTKVSNLIPHGSWLMYNCRYYLYYHPTSQEVEIICLLQHHNTSDRTKREWTSRINVACDDVKVSKTDLHLTPFQAINADQKQHLRSQWRNSVKSPVIWHILYLIFSNYKVRTN